MIKIKIKGLMKEDIFFFDCHNIDVKYEGDIIKLDFDQKILFGKRLVHRQVIINKNELILFVIRESIDKIPHKENEVK
jgi:hypothetical protein